MAGLLDAIPQVTAAIDTMCHADSEQLADAEAVKALYRQLERLNAVTTKAVAAFDAGGTWPDSGARAVAAWVAVCCHTPVASARRRVHLGRALRHMAAVNTAWLAGDIGEAHVRLFAAARTSGTAECFERDEDRLVGQACSLR